MKITGNEPGNVKRAVGPANLAVFLIEYPSITPRSGPGDPKRTFGRTRHEISLEISGNEAWRPEDHFWPYSF